MALDGVQRDEASDLLRRVLAAVGRGEVTADGPAAAATVRRLEGALLALEIIGDAPPALVPRLVSLSYIKRSFGV